MPKGRATKTSFKKGLKKSPQSGRKKGQRNRVTVLLKDAILEAAARVGQDGRGKGELTGYLQRLAVKYPPVYARLLERVLPLHVNVAEKTDRMTPAEAIERLRERGLPVPHSLNSLIQLPSPGAVADHLRGSDGTVLREATIEHDEFEADYEGQEE